MSLKEFLEKQKKNIAIIFFDKHDKMQCYEYQKMNFKNIPRQFLQMEVMDVVSELDCDEIWIA